MTLNDLNSHYTLNFHYCDLPLSNYFFLSYCREYLHIWPAEKCGKWNSGSWYAGYFDGPTFISKFNEGNCVFSSSYNSN